MAMEDYRDLAGGSIAEAGRKSASKMKIMKRIESRRKIRSKNGGARPGNRNGRYNRLWR
jgi:hypothetical protein